MKGVAADQRVARNSASKSSTGIGSLVADARQGCRLQQVDRRARAPEINFSSRGNWSSLYSMLTR
jgi:hypothetical protein